MINVTLIDERKQKLLKKKNLRLSVFIYVIPLLHLLNLLEYDKI